MRQLNVNTDFGLWYAMDHAEQNKFVVSRCESWTSDAEVRDIPGQIVFEDVRIETSYKVIVTKTDKAVFHITHHRRTVTATVFSVSQDSAAEEIALLKKKFPASKRTGNLVDVNFWYSTNEGPRSYERQLQAPSWKDIEKNYPKATREKISALRKIELKESSGKLLLWQGEPGTGKTFALRALAEEWASWCRVHYVLDPEKFFAEGDYLLSVILGTDKDNAGAPVAYDGEPVAKQSWRLVVLEDAGEMLAKDAKMQVGQGLARLLNLCDGLLGQGLRVLVLITTNEQIGTLHAAISRPGRCLSQITFEKFDALSAAKWLEDHGDYRDCMKQVTLADLYAVLNGSKPTTESKVVGFAGAA